MMLNFLFQLSGSHRSLRDANLLWCFVKMKNQARGNFNLINLHWLPRLFPSHLPKYTVLCNISSTHNSMPEHIRTQPNTVALLPSSALPLPFACYVVSHPVHHSKPRTVDPRLGLIFICFPELKGSLCNFPLTSL